MARPGRPVRRGESGLGLGHLGGDPDAQEAAQAVRRANLPKPDTKRIRRRGKFAEREVVAMWKLNGWPDAFRTPGSGAWRPYGAQDQSPFPMDVASGWPDDYVGDRSPWAGPWMAECKYDDRILRPSGRALTRSWTGEAFIRQTLGKMDAEWRRYTSTVGGSPVYPVAFMRGTRTPWRTFVPNLVVEQVWAVPTYPFVYVEVPTDVFFDEIARGILQG